MAAGDITRDNTGVHSGGNHFIITGTIEVDDTYRAFAIGGNYLVSCALQDTDGAGSYECDINVNASGTTANGTISVIGNHASVNTVRYEARCIL
jgi:predicted hotdog family 3-hydroxylacyl-ACP dehydratase